MVLCHCKWTRVFGFSPPTKLEAAVAYSSVSPFPETQMDRWERQRNVQGVLGVHVEDFQKAVQWLRTELEFGTWE